MDRYAKLFDLNEEQFRAVTRFRDYHSRCEARSDEGLEPNRALEWRMSCDDDSLELVCRCGATLHVTEPIYVTVEPKRFEWTDGALKKRIAEEVIDSAAHPRMHLLLEPTPTEFFTYFYGISKVYELANEDAFPNGFPQALMRRFIEETCGDCRDHGLDDAVRAYASDGEALAAIGKLAAKMIDECVPEIANVNLDDEKSERMERLCENELDLAQESLFQSALATLPDETFEQVRLHPSTTEMHFGLGVYLRNQFVHSGLLRTGIDPDWQSDGAISKLIKYCIPEFKEHDLVYGELESSALYGAYRYCMAVRGEFPRAEFTKHYDILLEAQEIDDANPYSLFDDEHFADRCAWGEKALEKRREYELATLYEIWNFDAVREELGDGTAKKCEEVCLAALHGERGSFVPSEIAYVMAGFADDRAMQAFTWAVQDCDAADYLPDELFSHRNLALEAVRCRGRQLERAKLFQDDDEIVLAAVANDPTAIEFASDRLQEDRHVLVEAASHAGSCLIFRDGPMAKHRDDDELVRLAIDANGANIAYASERIRSDFDFALRAVNHHRDTYQWTSYEELSDELKQDKRIALAVARWDEPPIDFPPASLADDDDIGEALSQNEDRSVLSGMSRRIKEKYMTDDELEKWGDDPWWWDDDQDAGFGPA